MYKLVIVTNQYAGYIEDDLYNTCFNKKHNYHVCQYKSIVDNSVCVYLSTKPRKRTIEGILKKLNTWSEKNHIEIKEVLLLNNLKQIVEQYM